MSNGVGVVQTFQVWDIGLYADPDKTGLAPPFEIEDYATTLAKCMRYYERTYRYDEQSYIGWYTNGAISTPRPVVAGAETHQSRHCRLTFTTATFDCVRSVRHQGSDLNGVTNQLTKDATAGIAAFQFQIAANARM